MEKQNIKWIDASKRHPKKNKSVFVLSKDATKANTFTYGLCSYHDGAYWTKVTGRSLIDGKPVSKIDYEYVVDNVVCWTDPKVVCGFAEDILKQVKWD